MEIKELHPYFFSGRQAKYWIATNSISILYTSIAECHMNNINIIELSSNLFYLSNRDSQCENRYSFIIFVTDFYRNLTKYVSPIV